MANFKRNKPRTKYRCPLCTSGRYGNGQGSIYKRKGVGIDRWPRAERKRMAREEL